MQDFFSHSFLINLKSFYSFFSFHFTKFKTYFSYCRVSVIPQFVCPMANKIYNYQGVPSCCNFFKSLSGATTNRSDRYHKWNSSTCKIVWTCVNRAALISTQNIDVRGSPQKQSLSTYKQSRLVRLFLEYGSNQFGETGVVAMLDSPLKVILNSNLSKSCLSITYLSVFQSSSNIAQSTAVILPCSEQNLKMIGKLKWM